MLLILIDIGIFTMDKILWEQFIYGKFGDGDIGKDYEVTGYSSHLEGIEFKTCFKNYRFWKEQPTNTEDHFAIGIFTDSENIKPYGETKYLILAQLQPPMERDQKGELKRLTVKRYFFQYRYVFVKEADLAIFRYKIVELLSWLSNQAIPVQKPEPSLSLSQKIPRVEPLEIELTENDLLASKNQLISFIKDLIDNNTQNLNLILKAISVLISNFNNSNARILLGTWEEYQEITLNYIQSIYLMLPAIYRSQISLVIGYIDVKTCKPANLMVSLISEQPSILPKGCEWLNSEHTIYSNLEEFAQVPEIEYVKALRKFFSEQPDENKIRKLVDELDDERLDKPLTEAGATLQTLLDNPSLVLNKIPSLSSNRDAVVIGLQRQQYSQNLAELAPRIDQVCALNRDRWEDIELLLKQLSEAHTLDSVLNFLDVLLNEKVWESPEANNLETLKQLKENPQGLSLAELINYTQNEPDKWTNLEPIAKTAFPNSKLGYLQFIDLTLGCSQKWREKFSRRVLYEWVSLAAQEPALLNQFSQKTTLAWDVFQANPAEYIDLLLKDKQDETSPPESRINVLIKCLSKLHVEVSKLSVARTKILQYVMESANSSDLMFKLVKKGFFAHLTQQEWQSLSEKIFEFPRELVDFIIGYLISINSPIDSNKEEYKQHSIKSAQKFAENSITDANKAGVFLETCQKLWFNKEELIEIVKILIDKALSPSSKNGSSIIEALFLQLSAWKLHEEQKLGLNKEELLDIANIIIEKALPLSPENGSSIIDILFSQLFTWKFPEELLKDENTRSSDEFIGFLKLLPQARTKVEQLNNLFFVGFLYQLLLDKSYYQYLNTWRDSLTDDDEQKRCYYSDFKRVCFDFVEQHEQTEVDKYVKALSDENLKEESEHLRETCDSYIGKKSPEEQQVEQVQQELSNNTGEPDSSEETQPEIWQETYLKKLEELETKVETVEKNVSNIMSEVLSEIRKLKHKPSERGERDNEADVDNIKYSELLENSGNEPEDKKKSDGQPEPTKETSNGLVTIETSDESDELFPTFKKMINHLTKVPLIKRLIKILSFKIF